MDWINLLLPSLIVFQYYVDFFNKILIPNRFKTCIVFYDNEMAHLLPILLKHEFSANHDWIVIRINSNLEKYFKAVEQNLLNFHTNSLVITIYKDTKTINNTLFKLYSIKFTHFVILQKQPTTHWLQSAMQYDFENDINKSYIYWSDQLIIVYRNYYNTHVRLKPFYQCDNMNELFREQWDMNFTKLMIVFPIDPPRTFFVRNNKKELHLAGSDIFLVSLFQTYLNVTVELVTFDYKQWISVNKELAALNKVILSKEYRLYGISSMPFKFILALVCCFSFFKLIQK